MNTRILLADDHRLFLAGLRALLEREPDLEVVGEVSDGLRAVGVAAETLPHLVIMDVSMPGMNGMEATRRILAQEPRTRILCLSMHAERRFVAAVLEAGAAGYLLKDCLVEELIRAVRAVMAGQVYLSPAVTAPVMAHYSAPRAEEGTGAFSRLTDREREVLQLLAEGYSTKAIAQRLGVSIKTIGTHREHVMRKLDLRSIAGLTKYAIDEGLTAPEPHHAP
ncbi:MAG: response regulator [Gemmatimonadales bacterium]